MELDARGAQAAGIHRAGHPRGEPHTQHCRGGQGLVSTGIEETARVGEKRPEEHRKHPGLTQSTPGSHGAGSGEAPPGHRGVQL